MATHSIGKLKFNLSGKGLAYRWGDGEVHRLFQGKKQQADADENTENLDPEAGMELQDDYDAAQDGTLTVVTVHTLWCLLDDRAPALVAGKEG